MYISGYRFFSLFLLSLCATIFLFNFLYVWRFFLRQPLRIGLLVANSFNFSLYKNAFISSSFLKDSCFFFNTDRICSWHFLSFIICKKNALPLLSGLCGFKWEICCYSSSWCLNTLKCLFLSHCLQIFSFSFIFRSSVIRWIGMYFYGLYLLGDFSVLLICGGVCFTKSEKYSATIFLISFRDSSDKNVVIFVIVLQASEVSVHFKNTLFSPCSDWVDSMDLCSVLFTLLLNLSPNWLFLFILLSSSSFLLYYFSVLHFPFGSFYNFQFFAEIFYFFLYSKRFCNWLLKQLYCGC